MELFELTRRLIGIESITPNEGEVGEFLFTHLSALAVRHDGHVEKMHVEPGRFNVFAHWGEPVVTLSTHMDTVPPYVPPARTRTASGAAGPATPKGSSPA